MSSREHQQAQDIAAEAGQLAEAGRRAEAVRLYAQAAQLERQALDRLTPDKVRTRGILGVSLAALLHKAGLFDQAEATVQSLLADSALLPAAREQLGAILQASRQARGGNGQAASCGLEAVEQIDGTGTA